ncbi:unnamed protein product [Protopolystoma xenopodis]|uniref:Lysophospholipid acyltransferase 7 n=1 Tax=Protopolystoma xenopodis TaxID=117903 RepID=A0A3S5BV86_9PLAT|nr:unnamed protein product [Protopolystoma xenopodis]
MLVSAYWHGLHLGYYLSFMTIPLALSAESGLASLITVAGGGLPPGSLAFLQWLIKMRVFEYCAMGFLLLDAPSTLAYWSSMYYCVHIVLGLLCMTGLLLHALLPLSAFRSAAPATQPAKSIDLNYPHKLKSASATATFPTTAGLRAGGMVN